MKRRHRSSRVAAVFRCIALSSLLAAHVIASAPALAEPIADEPPDHGLPFFIGEAAEAKPLAAKEVVPHQGLAAQNSIAGFQGSSEENSGTRAVVIAWRARPLDSSAPLRSRPM